MSDQVLLDFGEGPPIRLSGLVADFFVAGIPAPGGSKRVVPAGGRPGGRPMVIEDSRKAAPWKAAVAAAAREAHPGPPEAGPLALALELAMPRPKGHFGTGRRVGRLRASAPGWVTKRPDSTKLLRAVEDALTGVLWRDDAQVALQVVARRYADGPAGVRVVVHNLTEGGGRARPVA